MSHVLRRRVHPHLYVPQYLAQLPADHTKAVVQKSLEQPVYEYHIDGTSILIIEHDNGGVQMDYVYGQAMTTPTLIDAVERDYHGETIWFQGRRAWAKIFKQKGFTVTPTATANWYTYSKTAGA